MIRQLGLVAAISAALLFGSAPAAHATTTAAPPSDTTVTYAPGSSANIVMLGTNLTSAERATVTGYEFKVMIEGQPNRVITVSKVPVSLFNITPGTEIHAYLTLKGSDFGTSRQFDGGTYTQGDPATTGKPTTSAAPSTTPTPSRTSTSTPTRSAVPSQSSTGTPLTNAPVSSAPVTTPATPQVTAGPADPDLPDNVVSIVQNHLLPIIIIAVITAGILGFVTVFIRRRRQG